MRRAEFHAAFGNLSLRTGLPEQAAQHYRAAITLKPGDANAYFNLANACEELRDTAGAGTFRPGGRTAA